MIVNGGAALFVITAVNGPSADGCVLTSNDASRFPLDHLHRTPTNDHLAFRGLRVEGGPLCGHNAVWELRRVDC